MKELEELTREIREKPFHVDKNKFFNILKVYGSHVKFEYVRDGDDEFNPCGTVKKQATYELYGIFKTKKVMLVYKDHRRTHDEVEEEIIKKYESWRRQFIIKNHSTLN
ncbi:hypothetical protein [Chryseobacterium indologenes]|uniref:hypothetical protein n=1 Tax=Chryseobacterium indologenes TaxID=253 RepID=UPI00076E2E2A|nr:hypothetical protein [Chryseobacterium indologenes]